jgi:hypothetical protein
MCTDNTQFLAQVHNITPSEQAWIDAHSSKIPIPEDMREEGAPDIGGFQDFGLAGATHKIQGPGDQENWVVWEITDDEGYPELEVLAEFLQAFLKANRPDDAIQFTWVSSCTKRRDLDAGVFAITADQIRSAQMKDLVRMVW